MSRVIALSPRYVSKTVWYYEYPGSLVFVVEHDSSSGYCRAVEFRVKASQLRESLARMARRKRVKR